MPRFMNVSFQSLLSVTFLSLTLGACGGGPCQCVVDAPEGHVVAACGESVCLTGPGGAGYACSADGKALTPEPTACPEVQNFSKGTGGMTGLYETQLDDSGKARNYAVYVPTGYTGQTAVPLVLHFHGWRPAPAGVKQEVQYVWKATAEANDFIVVAPEGAPCPELDPGSDPFLCFDETRDGAWIEKLRTLLQSQYNIDIDRVYLSGHSGGSFFVQGYGLLNPTTYAAAAEFSGGCIAASGDYGNSCSQYEKLMKTPARKIPFYLTHNPGDMVVPQYYSKDMLLLFQQYEYPTMTHFEAYNGGSTGHSIDPKLPGPTWDWLKQYAHPMGPTK